ncbi:MAG: HNH endonuclease [Clostridia bacterium]|nr:HNH endonuclease [Clostridia bacterium]
MFIENFTADQKTLRDWYLKGKYTEYKCDICGLEPFWNGKELTLILDHINGHNHDDRLENLRWVCPNCNQQLPTTNGKNIKRLKEECFK